MSKTYTIKKSIPFQLSCAPLSMVGVSTTEETKTMDCCGNEIEERYHHEEEDKKKDKKENYYYIKGIASSTSVDWHGTEMSLSALEEMKSQFDAGVPYLPSHSLNEWDDVIGETVGSQINVNHSLINQNTEEQGYSLHVRVKLYKEENLSQKLYSRITRGEKVGMSIGGWFKEMEVTERDDGEIERVIIKDLQLDHLATTRTPSNPDSYIAEIKRHVHYIKEEEDGYVIKFGKSEKMQSSSEKTLTVDDNEQHVVKTEENLPVIESEVDKEDINLHNSIKDAKRSVDDKKTKPVTELSMSEQNTHNENVENVEVKRNVEDKKLQALEAKISTLERSLTTLVGALTQKQEQEQKIQEETELERKDNKISSLEQKIQTLQETVVRVSKPVRRSVINLSNKDAFTVKGEYNQLIERTKEDLGDTSAIVAVAKDQLERRSKNQKADYTTLQSDLVSIIRAAIADGVIVPPHARNLWR